MRVTKGGTREPKIIVSRECDEPMARSKGLLPCEKDCANCMACIEKTDTEATLPISEEALSYCGERKKEGKVFEDFARGMLTGPLKRWLKQAGIEKHITFHCFLPTHAVF